MAADMTSFGSIPLLAERDAGSGLGPLFKRQASECHSSPFAGGMALLSGHDVRRVGRWREGRRLRQHARGGNGPVAARHSVAEMGVPCGVSRAYPPRGN